MVQLPWCGGAHLGGRDARLAAADGAGLDGAGLVVAGQDLADAAVTHPQLSADVARPDAHLRQLHYAHAHRVGQRPPVHEHPAQLIDLPILLTLSIRTCKHKQLVRIMFFGNFEENNSKVLSHGHYLQYSKLNWIHLIRPQIDQSTKNTFV